MRVEAISFDQVGDPDGCPVIFHSGSPCSRLLPPWWDALARARGLRIVCFDRSGYGNTPAQPGRTIADVVDDTARAASALGIERFATWGVSGGAPFALGCAALLGQRVSAVLAVGSQAPNNGSEEWARGWQPEELEAARTGRRDVLGAFVAGAAKQLRQFDVPGWLTAWAGGFSLADRRFLADEGAAYLLGNIKEAVRPGVDGWVDDLIASAQPWGFDLAAIRQPVAIWHGTDDLMCPPRHARWLSEAMPHAELHVVEGEGHPSLILRRVEGQMDWIARRAAKAA
jgi:pimeloyl-ACP methyl ester carboxylesterase